MNGWIHLTLPLFLAAALYGDLRQHRIPNGLIGLMLAVGLAGQFGQAGWQGVTIAGAGLALGLAAFLPLYTGGGMGAGDVKLMAVSGVFLGPGLTLIAIVYTLIFGGLLVACRRRLRQGAPGALSGGRGIPYAPAIAAGIAASIAHTL